MGAQLQATGVWKEAAEVDQFLRVQPSLLHQLAPRGILGCFTVVDGSSGKLPSEILDARPELTDHRNKTVVGHGEHADIVGLRQAMIDLRRLARCELDGLFNK